MEDYGVTPKDFDMDLYIESEKQALVQSGYCLFAHVETAATQDSKRRKLG